MTERSVTHATFVIERAADRPIFGPPLAVAKPGSSRSATAATDSASKRLGGGPGMLPDYSPAYHAAFLLDPDGNNVEAVCAGLAGPASGRTT
jgi:hypothetical protein